MLQKRHNSVIVVFLVSNVSLVWTTLCYCTSRDDVTPVFLETKTPENISTKFLKNECFMGQIKGDLFCPDEQLFCLPLEGIRQAQCSQALLSTFYSYLMEQGNSADDKSEQRRFLLQDVPSWSEWGSWQGCIAVSCGENGINSRERHCLPKSTTGTCLGENIELSTCMKICSQQNGSVGTGWSEWSAWSTCTVPCNSSDTSVRTRTCQAAETAYCIGYAKDEKPCPGCTVTCGNGTRSRGQTCSNPHNDDFFCVGQPMQTEICVVNTTCIVDGYWSEWGPWGTCSVTCSNGTSIRNRTCSNPAPTYGGKNCIGMNTDSRDCIQAACKIDGGWSDWSAWFGCSATCGEGTDNRYRACNNPLPTTGGIYCHGPYSESTSCNLGHCPVDGYWSEWGPWGTCSVTCSNGTSTRNRTCSNPAPTYGGKNCIGMYTDRRDCIQAACKIDGGWADWSPWFGCSVSCDQGIDHRYRACTNPKPQHGGKYCQGSFSETSQCNLGSCPVDGNWTEWGPWGSCSVTCSNGTAERTRTCTNPKPKFGGKPCAGDSKDIIDCFMRTCAVDGNWAEWGSWGSCSVTCSNGTSVRNRTCDNPPPENGGEPCLGHSTDVMDCLQNPCPIDGNWTEWGPWGSCSVTCSNGTAERTRTCTNPKPEFGGKPCAGDSKDTIDCFMRTCAVDGNWAEWGSWGSCSVTCSNGTSVRNRTCDNPSPENGGKPCSGHSTDVMDCLQNPCPIDGNWGHWTPWSRCIGTCGSANKQRYRNCDKPLPENGGNICEGTPFEMIPCIPQSCSTTVQE